MTNTKINKLANSEVEFEGEIALADLEKQRKLALKNINNETTLPGFRKGHVPESVLLSRIGEAALLGEMAELALSEIYPELLKEHDIDAIGRPSVSITKLVPGTPVGFKIKTAVLPEVVLPDYKKVAKETNALPANPDDTAVSEKEVEDVILQVRKGKATQKKAADNEEKKIRDTSSDKNISEKNTEDEKLPPFTDEDAQELGDFKDLADLKVKIKENLEQEKKHKTKEKKRLEIVEKIISETKAELPDVLIESELDRMMVQFTSDISRMGLKPDEYLKHVKKTEEDLRKEWRSDASKRALTQIVFNKIAEAESVKAVEEEVQKEVNHLMQHYKDADPERARIYVESLMINEKVLQFLEEQK